MTQKDSLGDRMKDYEGAMQQTLPKRLPMIIRVDGKAFHSYTKDLKKSAGVAFDSKFENVMNLTAIKLCEEIQGAQIAYVQSDEISILVHGYKNLNSQGWFDNKIQKIVSVSAAIASTTFTLESEILWNFYDEGEYFPNHKPAYFDSRVFVLPEADVCNYFIWRQQDATRNSVQMLARSLYSHKECNNKNNSQLQEMTFAKGRNWNDEPASFKRGRCVAKRLHKQHKSQAMARRSTLDWNWLWEVDSDIPVFSDCREYIENFLCDTAKSVVVAPDLGGECV